MGIDLELADVAAARYQSARCQQSGVPCVHTPACDAHFHQLRSRGPYEFPIRRFWDINEKMRLTGMGYDGKPQDWPTPDAESHDRWRSQTLPGKKGIPGFKLRSNDRWLITVREIDEALEAYESLPIEQRAERETDRVWARWIEWLVLARNFGGFEAE